MSVTLAFHGIAQAAQPRLTEVFNTHVRRVRARLEALTTPEFLRLEGQIEQVPNQQRLRVSLRLKLPGGLITSSGEGEGLKSLLIAFDEIERKLDKHLRGRKAFVRLPARPVSELRESQHEQHRCMNRATGATGSERGVRRAAERPLEPVAPDHRFRRHPNSRLQRYST